MGISSVIFELDAKIIMDAYNPKQDDSEFGVLNQNC